MNALGLIKAATQDLEESNQRHESRLKQEYDDELMRYAKFLAEAGWPSDEDQSKDACFKRRILHDKATSILASAMQKEYELRQFQQAGQDASRQPCDPDYERRLAEYDDREYPGER